MQAILDVESSFGADFIMSFAVRKLDLLLYYFSSGFTLHFVWVLKRHINIFYISLPLKETEEIV